MYGRPSKTDYGIKRTPINRQAAVAIGLLKEGGRGPSSVLDRGPVSEAKSARQLKDVLDISYELAAKCLKNQLNRFELGEVQGAITQRVVRPLSEKEKNILRYAMGMCPSLVKVKAKPEHSRTENRNWRTSKICPSCGKKRLCSDFLFCPMCGCRLP